MGTFPSVATPDDEAGLLIPAGAGRYSGYGFPPPLGAIALRRSAGRQLWLEELVLRRPARRAHLHGGRPDVAVGGVDRVVALADVGFQRRRARGADRVGGLRDAAAAPADLLGLERDRLLGIGLVGHDQPDRAGAEGVRRDDDAAVDDRRRHVDRGRRTLAVDAIVVLAAAGQRGDGREGECTAQRAHLGGQPYNAA